jgi:hypothetical protein
MFYHIFADIILVLHLLFIVFVVGGGLLAFLRRWIIWLHLPAAAWGAMIEFFGWYCPLTPLENQLRRLAGQSGYEGGFIEHYMLPVIYPERLTHEIQIILGVIVIAVNLVIYSFLFVKWMKRS